jgi:hypothetical protein
MNKLYHAAPKAVFESIMKEGLDPSYATDKAIYLTNDVETAFYFARLWQNEHSEYVLLEIDHRGLDPAKLTPGRRFIRRQHDYVSYPDIIPPIHLSKVTEREYIDRLDPRLELFGAKSFPKKFNGNDYYVELVKITALGTYTGKLFLIRDSASGNIIHEFHIGLGVGQEKLLRDAEKWDPETIFEDAVDELFKNAMLGGLPEPDQTFNPFGDNEINLYLLDISVRLV